MEEIYKKKLWSAMFNINSLQFYFVYKTSIECVLKYNLLPFEWAYYDCDSMFF